MIQVHRDRSVKWVKMEIMAVGVQKVRRGKEESLGFLDKLGPQEKMDLLETLEIKVKEDQLALRDLRDQMVIEVPLEEMRHFLQAFF